MIISASRRTDIPAFYSEWLENRLREGFALMKNPRNPRQVRRISLAPEDVDGIVLWTKNPAPMLPMLSALEPYAYYFQFTLTPYGTDVEPGLPDKDSVIVPVFQELSERIGKERVVWRYDPIFFGDVQTPQWHLERFHELAARLSGYTEECVISFLDYYRNTERQMRGLGVRELPPEEKAVFLRNLARAAASYRLSLKACAEAPALGALGIGASSCIDAARLEWIGGYPERPGSRPVPDIRDRNQRPFCGCAASVDIGAYNTCAHGCRYCYANYNPALIKGNQDRHDPKGELL